MFVNTIILFIISRYNHLRRSNLKVNANEMKLNNNGSIQMTYNDKTTGMQTYEPYLLLKLYCLSM